MNKIMIMCVLCVLTASAARAQRKEYKGEMGITPLQLEQRGDSLLIGVDFDMNGVVVESQRSISLIPTLIAAETEKPLPEVMVKGRNNFLTSKRELALMNSSERKQYSQNAPYAIVKGYKSSDPKTIRYRKTIRFEPWMIGARLDVREDLCGCGNSPRELSVSTLIDRVKPEPVAVKRELRPALAYIRPQVEAVKKREIESEAFLDFAVAKTDIRAEYMNNPRELTKITSMVTEVGNDRWVTVKQIAVVGYASPEGSLKLNRQLSEGRANALVDYLVGRFDYPKNMYRVEFGGENWNGLRVLLLSKQMENKEMVLELLDNPAIDNETRKLQLKRLNGGKPYRYMIEAFYPSLRKAICKIEYEVKGFDVDEAKEVFKSRPQNLSLNELFLVANTYENGSAEFIGLFETAVNLFPLDETANLNAAVAALSRKDTTAAEHYLTKVKTPSAQYINARGVLLLLRGEYHNARKLFIEAEKEGLPEATENLNELEYQLTSNLDVQN